MKKVSESELVAAFREWTEAVMHRSMDGYVGYARDHNLSMSQLGALFHVHKMGACGVSDIGERLGVTTAAVSQMLDRLVEAGLVVREEDPRDRRSKKIEMTPLGQKVLAGAIETRYHWVHSLSRELTHEERAQAVRVLRTLSARANELKEMPS